MRYLVLILTLLPVAANAASLSKADCEAVYLAFEGCAIAESPIRTGSEAHRWQELHARHPSFLEKIMPMCKQIYSGALSKDVAFRRFCKTKPTWE
ncbi:hypothetical protein [Bradyrhizobium erythrophlei]|uniref:HdeA/HdeB family protein n=1 Tax=Bradyrhizobium erythrophlei TaxID=1437360 RepID=A0A1H4P0L8_9BRAD|nr:hypothetical protein [Bradyrhizobium erythrophlei]SEC00884.1 hypothetical protein SAMN05444164_0785 [Bradyrhizobium erythrophlei]